MPIRPHLFGATSLLALMLAGEGPAQTAPVADSATAPPVEAMPLDAPSAGAAGLLPPSVTGLPASLWRNSDPDRLQELIAAVDPQVPVLQTLMRTLMLAEADPPRGPSQGEPHLAARLDWLTRNGAVEETLALLEIAGHETRMLYRRWADLNLLLGRAEAPCATLRARPDLSSDLALRVFCIARSGDWPRAALLLQSARTLGEVSARKADLLERFLDDQINEGRPPLLPPVRPTPLDFRLFEAIGEPLPTAPLPLAFSVLDLSGDNGWRAQIEAAERLARVGALPSNRLLGYYTLRKPAASGGVWDRTDALQRFDDALERGSPNAVGPALTRLWPQISSARLLVPFAEIYASRLADIPLDGRAARMQLRTVFLSPQYEALAQLLTDDSAETQFLRAIARGAPPSTRPDLPHAEQIARGFAEDALLPAVLAAQLEEGRLGEVILRAIALFTSGAEGNEQDLVDALAVFRSVGLEDVARRAALQLSLLDAERSRP